MPKECVCVKLDKEREVAECDRSARERPGTNRPGIAQGSVWRQVARRSRVFRQGS